jgi:hypothetical protein
MDLTPDILRAAYMYLDATPPFNGWNLPDAEDVEFVVTKTKKEQGCCHCFKTLDGLTTRFMIEISTTYHKYTLSLLGTMAHEMVHLHEFMVGFNKYRMHGKVFKALAKEVCDAHGFDPGQF